MRKNLKKYILQRTFFKISAKKIKVPKEGKNIRHKTNTIFTHTDTDTQQQKLKVEEARLSLMLPSNQTLSTRSADKKNVTSTTATATAFVQWFLMTRHSSASHSTSPQASSPTTRNRTLPWVRQAPQLPHGTSKPCRRPGYSMHCWPSMSESISTKGRGLPIHAPIPSPLFQPELIPSEYKKKHNILYT